MRTWSPVHVAVFVVLSVLVCAAAPVPTQDDPRTNDRFPIKGHLSPPVIGAVHACATHVYVSGFVPHATIRVFKNGTTQIGMVTPNFGFSTVPVAPLASGDMLTATQTVLGETSAPTDP